MKTLSISRTLKAIRRFASLSVRPEVETVIVAAGQLIPSDGLVIEGAALVDESAIVGVSTPAVRSAESGLNQVLAGTLVLEGSLTIKTSRQSG